MRTALAVLGAVCLAPLACSGTDADPGPPRPDVVILSIETLRHDFVGSRGARWQATPRLDAFAEGAIAVSRAYAVAPWTRGNVGSLLTGMLPSRHGAVRNDAETGLSPAVATLASLFGAAGYRSLGVVTNGNLSEKLGFARGFSEYLHLESKSAGRLNAVARDWVRDQPRSREPLLVFLHYVEPHRAFFGNVFDRRKKEGVAEFLAQLGEGERVAAIARYLELVREADRGVGQFLDSVLPELRNPIVIVTSDHGEEWFDHGSAFHGRTVYEELIRVPLLIRLPGAAARTVEGPVRSVDILPTLCELTGVPCPRDLDGVSVVGALLDGQAFPQEVFSETEYEGPLREALIAGDLKLIRAQGGPPPELYDLRDDPGETRNLHATHPRAAGMTRRLDAIRAELDRSEPAPATAPSGEERESLRRQLESLGYLAEPDVSTGQTPGVRWPERALAYAQYDPETHQRVILGTPLSHPRFSTWSFAPPAQEIHLVLARERSSGTASLGVDVDGRRWLEIGPRAFERRLVVVPLVLPPSARQVTLMTPRKNVELRSILVPADPDAPPPSHVQGIAGALRLDDVLVTSDGPQPLSLRRSAAGAYEVVVGSRPVTLRARMGDAYSLQAPGPTQSVRFELTQDRVFLETAAATGVLPGFLIVEADRPPDVAVGRRRLRSRTVRLPEQELPVHVFATDGSMPSEQEIRDRLGSG